MKSPISDCCVDEARSKIIAAIVEIRGENRFRDLVQDG